MKSNTPKRIKPLPELQEPEPKIGRETRKSIAAVLMIGLAVLLFLAKLEKAGPIGFWLYLSLNNLFGWGYYLMPAMAVVVALVFLVGVGDKKKFISTTLMGACLVFIFGLGIIDVIFPEKSGWMGNIIGLLEKPFGYTGSLMIMGMFILIALLITLNAKIKIATDEKDELKASTASDTTPALPELKTSATAVRSDLIINTSEGKKELKDLETEIDKEASRIDKEKDKNLETDFGVKIKDRKKPIIDAQNYIAPPLSLLKSSIEKPTSGDLRANANIIKRTLESFGIPVEMGEISIGPKVTRYTLKPAEGIKLTRITALNQDMALALAAHPIRIEAPIPGKSLVGLEVPNKTPASVRLGSLLPFPEFTDSGPLSFILGKDVTGEPIIGNIEKMPHLLVAGSTNSGKSVALHSLIISLLYKNSPESLRLILIDPKRVELSVYGGVPHLVAPVIIEGKKAIGVFRWAIQEMEKRYETLLAAGARDIKSYNKNRRGKTPALPYLVIVVDELADLMTAFGRDIETCVVRLAQMARATGIHLVLSTQRPSVEVITGLIKANITSRIALQVASQIDSRTILDTAGAEKLLGGGDMLFISNEFSRPKRIQGAYVSEEEINKVAEFIRENNPEVEAADSAQIINQMTDKPKAAPDFEKFASEGENEDDELYEEAVQTVVEAQKASASLLQRRLKVGYARAARLLDIMEAKGIIGQGDGAKPREVYLNKSNETNFDEVFEDRI